MIHRRMALSLLCVLLVVCFLAACGTSPEEAAALSPVDVPAAAATVMQTDAPTSGPTPSPTPSPRPVPTDTPDPTAEPTPTAVPMTDPIITLEGNVSMTVNAAFAFEDPGAAARDCHGTDLTDRITVEGKVIPYLVGKYVLTYTVADDDGNPAQAQRTVTVQPVQLPEVIDPPPKTIYLTFDDGPCNNTRLLLDILKQYDVKATFFVVGVRGNKELIKRMYEEGHSIGVHSNTHVYEEIYASEEAFFADFLAAEEVIYEQTGQYTHIFRFPGGSHNTASWDTPGIMTRLTKIMEDMGYRYFDWNVNSSDAMADSEKSIFDYYCTIRARLLPDDCFNVVLQHDLNGLSVRAMETFIPWALENGYTFLPLDMTSPVVHSQVNN